MRDFIVAMGLVLVIEGLVYGGFPSAAKKMAAQAAEMPEAVLRTVGLAAIVIGVGVVWLVRG
ncbi:DUF2065 family protein [Aminobacter carboxidus]|uniref:DUF2065 family protein n=1 Tax=Aminobacter carboxidus TaxID=376165 RepID=A0ABR9GTA2_9HYPH|nr:DUF2065 family protein [Aminobacter carboxidus]